MTALSDIDRALSDARALFVAGKVSEASNLAEAALASNPSHSGCKYLAGYLRSVREDTKSGVELMIEAQSVVPSRDELLQICAFVRRLLNPDRERLLARLAAAWSELLKMSDEDFRAPIRLALGRLGWRSDKDTEWLAQIDRFLLMPLFRLAIANGQLDLAHAISAERSRELPRRRALAGDLAETSRVEGTMWRQAARKIEGEIDLAPLAPMIARDERYRVAFILTNDHGLSHIDTLVQTRALVDFLVGYGALAEQPFEPIVVCVEGAAQTIQRAGLPEGFHVVAIDDRSNDPRLLARAVQLREVLAESRAAGAVLVGSAPIAPFLLALPIARTQILWSLQAGNCDHVEIDGSVEMVPASIAASRPERDFEVRAIAAQIDRVMRQPSGLVRTIRRFMRRFQVFDRFRAA